MAIKVFRTTDSIGRPRTIHVCDAGHWHPNHRRAAECNRKTRQNLSDKRHTRLNEILT